MFAPATARFPAVSAPTTTKSPGDSFSAAVVDRRLVKPLAAPASTCSTPALVAALDT